MILRQFAPTHHHAKFLEKLVYSVYIESSILGHLDFLFSGQPVGVQPSSAAPSVVKGHVALEAGATVEAHAQRRVDSFPKPLVEGGLGGYGGGGGGGSGWKFSQKSVYGVYIE
jgi:hypothetical protein